MDLFWYIVVVLLIILKIFFYICWYRSRQRQLANCISSESGAQFIIMGGRGYRHQASVWPGWRAGVGHGSAGETSGPLPPTSPYSQLHAPPPYQAVSRMGELKPPPYSECALGGATAPPWTNPSTTTPDPRCVTEAPPPYKEFPHTAAELPQSPWVGEGPSGAGP